MTTHGTPTGYTNGCHGAASCDNHRTGLMTCTEAHIRYQGDYQYRKAVDAGTATAEREQFAKEKRPSKRVVVETKAERAIRAPRVKAEPKPRAKRIHKPPANIRHGVGFNARYCKTDCPNEIAGGKSCRQAAREYQATLVAKVKAGNGPPITHGKRHGYQSGCRDRGTCPMPAGKTCPDVQAAYGHAHHKAAA